MNEFMKDRYGVDELATLMGGAGVLLALIGTIADLDPLTWLALAIILLALARAFSKNVGARRRENESFCAFAAKVPGLRAIVERMGGASPAGGGASTGAKAPAGSHGPSRDDLDRAKRTAKKMWKERKTSSFLKCPTCGQILSVPKGKGKIRVTCPKCHSKMETRS